MIDGKCQCLRSDAIDEECKLPNKETPPVTTTTTTMVLMTSEQKKTEATELTSALTLAVESTSSIIYNSDSGAGATETPETTTPNASQVYNSEIPTTTATYSTETSTSLTKTMTSYGLTATYNITETPK